MQALLGGQYSVSGVLALVADRVAEEMDTALASADALHSNLRNEYENGRLLRLLFKLGGKLITDIHRKSKHLHAVHTGFINERPEYALAPQWAETGDRRASYVHKTLCIRLL